MNLNQTFTLLDINREGFKDLIFIGLKNRGSKKKQEDDDEEDDDDDIDNQIKYKI